MGLGVMLGLIRPSNVGEAVGLLAGIVVFGLGVVFGHGRLDWRWFVLMNWA